MKPTDPRAQPTMPTVPAPSGEPPLLSSRQLFREHNVVRIEHGGQCYLLRVTSENKLILTK